MARLQSVRAVCALLVLGCVLGLASAQSITVSAVPRILPQNLRQSFLVETKVEPEQYLHLTVQSTSQDVVVSPTLLTFLPNQTYSQLVRIEGVRLTTTPVIVSITTNSSEAAFAGFSYQQAHEVVSSCGVVQYAPAECPEIGSWVYLQAQMKKANPADTTIYNVTFADLYGFEVYLNNQVNCPSESSHVGDGYTGARYTRLDVSFESTGVVYGSPDLDIRVGLKRVNSTQCTFSATMWDPAQTASGVESVLSCTVPMQILPECSFTLLAWQIALIVIGAVIVLVAIVIIAVVIHKKRKN